MPTIKYQVFVSSTYVDLIEERNAVIETLVQIGCLPVGMELFPASNTDTFDYIRQVIDESDFYVLLIGGRYGTIKDGSNLSYTELEFQYAVSRGIPVIALLKTIPKVHLKKQQRTISWLDSGKKSCLKGS